MGGNIRMIARVDGKTMSSDAWTNPIPRITFTNKFFNDKDYFITEFKKWAGLIEDNLNNSEYGIVVVDYDKKKVYNHQHYCSIGETNPSSISLATRGFSSGYEFYIEGCEEFINDGALYFKREVWSTETNELIEKKIEKINSKDDLLKYSDKGDFGKLKKKKEYDYSVIFVDTSVYGWEIINYQKDDPLDLFEKLYHNGFDLSTTDLDTWSSYEYYDNPDSGIEPFSSEFWTHIRNKKIEKIL